ncbi:MAG: immunoglobulin domain-containing protein [Acidithiobacillus sp.]|uniref:PKD domain-containing protein n=1 Tax=Acidithiobacillus sp. TaxID=1872118 RepID=UPI002589CDA3|nr:PKD domain-containing protein [Acidithiobacillus sp.]MCE5419164.1 immunoglobulin domain-containing protein [Acidithiobacillus sp.]
MGVFSRLRNLCLAAGLGLALGFMACGGGGSTPAATAPAITTQPTNQTVTAGQNASFTVAATGNGTLSYQWRKGGSNLAGQTSATLSLTAVSAGDAGSYDVVVTNTLNGTTASTTSTAATLTVNAAATLTIAPTTQNLHSNESFQFQAQVSGLADASLIWSVVEANGGSVSGTGAYTAPGFQAGTFHVRATSAAMPSLYAEAAVNVSLVEVSASVTAIQVGLNEVKNLSATVTGASDSGLVWVVDQADGGTITPNGTYTAPSHAGAYSIHAISTADTTKSAQILVTVQQAVAVTIDPTILPEGSVAGYTLGSSLISGLDPATVSIPCRGFDTIGLYKNGQPFLLAPVFPGDTSVVLNAQSTALAHVLMDPALMGQSPDSLKTLAPQILAHAKFPDLVAKVVANVQSGSRMPLSEFCTVSWDDLSSAMVASLQFPAQTIQARNVRAASLPATAGTEGNPIDVAGSKGWMTAYQASDALAFDNQFMTYYCAYGTDESKFEALRPAPQRLGYTADWVNFHFSLEQGHTKSWASLGTMGFQGKGQEVVNLVRVLPGEWDITKAGGYARWMNILNGISLISNDILPNVGASGEAKTVVAKLSRSIGKFTKRYEDAKSTADDVLFTVNGIAFVVDVVAGATDHPTLQENARDTQRILDMAEKVLGALPETTGDMGRNGRLGKIQSFSKLFMEKFGKELVSTEEDAIRDEMQAFVRTQVAEGRLKDIVGAIEDIILSFQKDLENGEILSALNDTTGFTGMMRMGGVVGKALLSDPDFVNDLVSTGASFGADYAKNASVQFRKVAQTGALTYAILNKVAPWVYDCIESPERMSVLMVDGKLTEVLPPDVSFEVYKQSGELLAVAKEGMTTPIQVQRGDVLKFHIKANTPGVNGDGSADLVHQTTQTILLTELKPLTTVNKFMVTKRYLPNVLEARTAEVPCYSELTVEKKELDSTFYYTQTLRDSLGERTNSFTDDTLLPGLGGKSASGQYNQVDWVFGQVAVDQPLSELKLDFYNYGYSYHSTITVPVQMIGNQPPVASFTATVNPTTGSVALDASQSLDPDGTIISYFWDMGDGVQVYSGQNPLASYLYLSSGTKTITLTVMDDSGATASSSQAVSIPATVPQILSFTATPSTIQAGQSATLAWTVSGADSLSIDNGVGDVTGKTSITVSPSATTTYTLTATNTAGSVTASATVSYPSGLTENFHDMVVEGSGSSAVVYSLVSELTGSGAYYTDPDGMKSYERNIYILRFDSTKTPVKYLVGTYFIQHGALSVESNLIRVFFNHKTQNGTYGMAGEVFVLDKATGNVSTHSSMFTLANWGWFPKFIGSDVSHFSYAGYFRMLNTTNLGSVSPGTMQQEATDAISAHSNGLMVTTNPNGIRSDAENLQLEAAMIALYP